MFIIAEIYPEIRRNLEDSVLSLINFVEKLMPTKTKTNQYL